MLYIMGDYVHTHRLTQLNTLSLHTHTDMHTPKQLNVCCSNTFCVNSSFLLPKQTAPLLLQHNHTMWPFTPFTAAADCGSISGLENITFTHSSWWLKLCRSCCGWVSACVAVFWHWETKCELVVGRYGCQNRLGFGTVDGQFGLRILLQLAAAQISFGPLSEIRIGPLCFYPLTMDLSHFCPRHFGSLGIHECILFWRNWNFKIIWSNILGNIVCYLVSFWQCHSFEWSQSVGAAVQHRGLQQNNTVSSGKSLLWPM